jgi:uncharacterized protein YqjF (DUF2071 family)
MLNYAVDPAMLKKHVPNKTELDSFCGTTYLSLVGFRFCLTKLFGSIAVPFHSDFEEVNLRFYVRHKDGSEYRRGVVFIAEIVPKQAVATLARAIYGENYKCLLMKHSIGVERSRKTIAYEWQIKNQWCKLAAQEAGAAELPEEGSLEQYITEHNWGYSAQNDGSCMEYHVSHVPWKVSAALPSGFVGDATELYGAELARVLQNPPTSAFIADGSPVTVYRGSKCG